VQDLQRGKDRPYAPGRHALASSSSVHRGNGNRSVRTPFGSLAGSIASERPLSDRPNQSAGSRSQSSLSSELLQSYLRAATALRLSTGDGPNITATLRHPLRGHRSRSLNLANGKSRPRVLVCFGTYIAACGFNYPSRGYQRSEQEQVSFCYDSRRNPVGRSRRWMRQQPMPVMGMSAGSSKRSTPIRQSPKSSSARRPGSPAHHNPRGTARPWILCRHRVVDLVTTFPSM
jgi:hypothetical protein